jgi:hypothetical protein
MSKVKIEGNASGTGTLTIAAPNTNTDRTLTLPDADITLGGGVDGVDSDYTSGTAVKIDSSGNVGIGTTSPTTNYTNTVHVHSATSGASVHLTDSGSGSTASDGLEVFQYGNDGYIWERSSGTLRFGTSATERMRIDSSGNLLVGITSLPAYSVSTGTHFAYKRDTGALIATQSTSGWANFYIGNNTGGGNAAMSFRYAGGNVGSIYINTSSTSYNTSSDYRLKEDVQPMSGSIDRVKALNPVNFAWKEDGTRVDGFLAHEAAEVVPEAVSGEKDAMTTEEYEVTPAVLDDDGNVVTEAVMGEREVPDYQGIDQSKLVPLLTSALQEAIAKIEDLETRLAAVEGA